MAKYIIEYSKIETVSVEVEAESHLAAQEMADKLLSSDYWNTIDEYMIDFYDPDWTTRVIDNCKHKADLVLTPEEVNDLIGE